MAFCVSSIPYWSFLCNLLTTVASLSLSVTQLVHQRDTGGTVTLEWLLNAPTHISPESVTFRCYRVEPKPTRTFCVNDKFIKYPEHQDEQFRGRVRWEREALQNGTLKFHLSNLTTQDSGTYHCTVALGDVEDDEITFLNVIAPKGSNSEIYFHALVPPAPALKVQRRGQYVSLGVLCFIVLLVYYAYLTIKQEAGPPISWLSRSSKSATPPAALLRAVTSQSQPPLYPLSAPPHIRKEEVPYKQLQPLA